ncbi:hypothetical protein GYMLUDRAFT_109396, partial [Collybiopsis luxurians FD-317 M1]
AYVSAIKNWITREGYVWQGGALLRDVFKGVKCSTPPSSICPKCPPVKQEYLFQLNHRLDHCNGLDCAVLACAKLMFWSQLRGCETLATCDDPHLYDPLKLPLIKNLKPAGHGFQDDIHDSMLTLPSTKTEITKGHTVLVPFQYDNSDP